LTTLSRRTLLRGAAVLGGTAMVGPLAVGSAAAGTVRPTGADYIRYEDLYRSGDTVTKALSRLSAAKIVTFPEGKFVCKDFDATTQAGISVPRLCRGIVGSGKGTLGGSTGTVFTIQTRSSTKGSGAKDPVGRLYVPVQGSSTPTQLNLMKQVSQLAPSVWKNFQIAGTDQGHVYSGFQVYNTAGANTFESLLINGWEGNAGAPPGETAALSVNGPGAHVVNQVEVDGRRAVGGPEFGAMGLTFQNSVGATFRDCNVHHCRAATYALFQSFNGYLINCVSDATVSSGRGIGNGGINFERTAGWTLVTPTIIARPMTIHMAHSNDTFVLNQAGRQYSTVNGSLTVVDPKYSDTRGNGLFYIQSWTPYWNGDTMRTPPLVTTSDWKTHREYLWVHGSTRLRVK
jgi:hypothetical protein